METNRLSLEISTLRKKLEDSQHEVEIMATQVLDKEQNVMRYKGFLEEVLDFTPFFLFSFFSQQQRISSALIHHARNCV